METPETQGKPESDAALAPALGSAYTVGRVIRLKTMLGKYHLWKITGIHYGTTRCENLVSLRRLDIEPGTAFGQIMVSTIAPLCLLSDNPNVEVV